MWLRYEWRRTWKVEDFRGVNISRWLWVLSLEMVQRCGGNTYEQGESRRGEER
jgi:hypothetical protein